MKIAVIGGGITGLSCAYELSKAAPDYSVRLVEGTGRLGGKILSRRSEGALFECGPDSFLTAKPWALELVRELGLGGRLVPTDDKRKDVYLFSRGRLRRYPPGLMTLKPRAWDFLRSDVMGLGAKLRFALERFVARNASQDESLAKFTLRRFGSEALETIVGPVLAGIYAGEPERLSLASTFPQFKELELKYGSVLRGLARAGAPKGNGVTAFMTLAGGLEELVKALAGKLPAGTLLQGRRLKRLSRLGAGYRLVLEGEELEAQAVVLALPADAAAEILSAFDPGLSGHLSRIRFTSTATVSFLFASAGFAIPLDGFGFVVDRREGKSVIAATYTSTKFPGRVPKDKALIRCFLGGGAGEKALAGSDEELADAAFKDLSAILGLAQKPLETLVCRWPGANPQYDVGHGELLARIEARLKPAPGLILAGSSYRGVGIPDCVRSGRAAARRIAESLGAVPSGAVV